MRLLSDEAVQKWCEERAIQVDPQRTLRLDGGHYLEITLPEGASRVIALADALLEVAFEEGSGFQGALHWVTGAGIWGSYSESVALKILEQMRTAYGGSRPFSDARGHLFQATELLDAQAFLTHSMLFGWDAYLVPAAGENLVVTSHDEVVYFVARKSAAHQRALERLAPWKARPVDAPARFRSR